MMEYCGYRAELSFDDEAGVLHGEVVNTRDVITFQGTSSAHRTRALIGWLRWYNRRRPHGSLGGLPPVSRVSHLCGQYS